MGRLRILAINNDPQTSKLLRISFRAKRYDYDIVATGQDGLRQAAKKLPDLVILDLDLPDMDGIEVVHKLRECLSIPVIILTSRDQPEEKILALDAGADDYVTQPCSMQELMARIRAALRRNILRGSQSAIACGELVVDLTQCRVNVNGKKVNLSPIEHRLLIALAHQKGNVMTYQELLEICKGATAQGDTHYIRQYIVLLRKKIEANPTEPKYILTASGLGYWLNCPESCQISPFV